MNLVFRYWAKCCLFETLFQTVKSEACEYHSKVSLGLRTCLKAAGLRLVKPGFHPVNKDLVCRNKYWIISHGVVFTSARLAVQEGPSDQDHFNVCFTCVKPKSC